MAAITAQRLADNIKDGVGTEVWAPIRPATAEYNGKIPIGDDTPRSPRAQVIMLLESVERNL